MYAIYATLRIPTIYAYLPFQIETILYLSRFSPHLCRNNTLKDTGKVYTMGASRLVL